MEAFFLTQNGNSVERRNNNSFMARLRHRLPGFRASLWLVGDLLANFGKGRMAFSTLVFDCFPGSSLQTDSGHLLGKVCWNLNRTQP